MKERAMTPTGWETCDGQLLRNLVQAGLFQLNRHVDNVNALNVFPVPDGDTGTNMRLTMLSAFERLNASDTLHLGEAAQLLARGALMGARGNSGVILSQIWRGFAEVVADHQTIDLETFAAALRHAFDTAWLGVSNPVEGTILTISRVMADSAEIAATQQSNLRDFLNHILTDSRLALANTPNQLPILKQAGVVDSGGQGLIYIFEGMLNWLQGDLDLETISSVNGATAASSPISAQQLAKPDSGVIQFPYDVQFMLIGHDLDVQEVRRRIDAMGDSTVVVGDSELIKVHIHVEDPGEPLSYGASLGAITDVVVENMQEQMEQIIAAARPIVTNSAEIIEPTLQPDQIGVVAVTPGPGIADVMRSMGVSVIVDGGQTNNPSTEQLLTAIEQVPSNKVVILPNNKNIHLAAQSARDLSDKQVAVIPTRSIPQGISALVALDATGDLDEVAAAMTESAEDVTTAQVTTAVRDVDLNGVKVSKGQLIGIIDDQLCAADTQMPNLIRTLVEQMHLAECEIITLFYGAGITEEEAETVADQIETAFPDVEVETMSGGQQHYFYILGAE